MTHTSHLSNALSLRRFYLPLFLLTICVSTFITTETKAQIKSPGAHQMYSVELEPHGLVQWDVDPGNDEGIGLGMRASIPVIDNGPVSTINNSLAIGFGLDWAWSGDCGRYDDCDAHNISLPVVVQWNFFFTPVVSAFVELGFAIVFETWDEDYLPRYDDDFDVDPGLYFLIGPRFTFGDVAIPIRIGWPNLSIGVSFLI